jgi:serine/threonine-protein kinase
MITGEQRTRVEEVLSAALDRDSGERAAFVERACGGDAEVRREVESLLGWAAGGSLVARTEVAELAEEIGEEQPTLFGGERVGRYEVLGKIGAGGMGEVYLARDASLGRQVALKLLPRAAVLHHDRLRRFRWEAQAASALNHPNILTIHEVGQAGTLHYIVMEYVEGETLRDRLARAPLGVREALDVAAQVADALSAAHRAGIAHRDIKPENIMLRRDDERVKVLDFGLAKPRQRQRGAADSEARTQTPVNTAPGAMLGTVAYMSPEQARGLEVDERTDIWSLGCVLYEMGAGKVPFAGASSNEIISAIISKERQTPLARFTHDVPERLEEIVAKALAKDREERYQTARDLALDLKSLKEELEVEARLKRGPQPNTSGKEFGTRSGGLGVIGDTREQAARSGHTVPARRTVSVEYLIGEIKRHRTFAGAALLTLLFGAIGLTYFAINRNNPDSGARGSQSIAVLPLKPINVANRDEIYEIGIADALINRLGSTKGLVIRPLSAMRRYADVGQDPLAAGREQQVDYVLASNYQLAAGKIRITAQLFDVNSGQIEETYKSEKDAGDVFAMEDAIAGEIGNLLQARFATTSSSQAAKRGTSNEEAYLLYLQGMYLVDKESSTDAKRAIELFDKALSLDPDYAKAWAGKARAHCSFAHWGGSSPDAEFAKAEPAIGQALALDNNLPEAYGVLGIIKADYDWNFAEGERLFLRAIEIAPDSDNLNRWYANRLAGQGRSEEAIARIKTAIDLNPNSVFHQIMYGRILYFARRYDDAITQLQRVIEMDSARPVAYNLLWRSNHKKGDYSRAYESFMRFQQLIGTKGEVLKNYETLYAKSGWQAVLLRYMEIVKANDEKGSAAYTIAVLSALLGQREQSLHYLNDAVKNRSLEISSINGDPSLDLLRDDPRFAELVRRVESK